MGTLHGRPMERLVFCYDRHEEIIGYSVEEYDNMYYHPTVMHVFCYLYYTINGEDLLG